MDVADLLTEAFAELGIAGYQRRRPAAHQPVASVRPGAAAALAYGAPVAARFDRALDLYLPDQSVLRRATTLLGTVGSPDSAPATVRVAPVAAAVTRRWQGGRPTGLTPRGLRGGCSGCAASPYVTCQPRERGCP